MPPSSSLISCLRKSFLLPFFSNSQPRSQEEKQEEEEGEIEKDTKTTSALFRRDTVCRPRFGGYDVSTYLGGARPDRSDVSIS